MRPWGHLGAQGPRPWGEGIPSGGPTARGGLGSPTPGNTPPPTGKGLPGRSRVLGLRPERALGRRFTQGYPHQPGLRQPPEPPGRRKRRQGRAQRIGPPIGSPPQGRPGLQQPPQGPLTNAYHTNTPAAGSDGRQAPGPPLWAGGPNRARRPPGHTAPPRQGGFRPDAPRAARRPAGAPHKGPMGLVNASEVAEWRKWPSFQNFPPTRAGEEVLETAPLAPLCHYASGHLLHLLLWKAPHSGSEGTVFVGTPDRSRSARSDQPRTPPVPFLRWNPRSARASANAREVMAASLFRSAHWR